MLNPGDCIKVKTTTLQDVFGEVVYQVKSIDQACPECKGNDAIWFVMLGGSGPSARPGYPILDCQQRIRRDIARGITQILTPAQAAAAVKHYSTKDASKPGREIEM